MSGAPRSSKRIPQSENTLRQRHCFRVHFGEQPNCDYPRVHSVVAGNISPLRPRSRIPELLIGPDFATFADFYEVLRVESSLPLPNPWMVEVTNRNRPN